MTIYQGDQFYIPVTVSRDDLDPGTVTVEGLEVIVAGKRKTYPGEIELVDGVFLYPLLQEETLELDEGVYDISVRPRYSDNTIIGWLNVGTVNVRPIEGAEEI